MSRLIAATILPDRTFIGEVQVELTWERLTIRRGDWRGLGQALDEGTVPLERQVEIRTYANEDLAQAAIRNLQKSP